MEIVVDTREQLPLFTGPQFIRWGMVVGDYTTRALFHNYAIERKSMQDLCGTLCKGNARFHRELIRAKANNIKLVMVVEGTRKDFVAKNFPRGNERKISGETLGKIISTFERKHKLEVHWCRSRLGAQVMVRVNKADRSAKDGKEFPSKVVNGTIGTIIKIVDKPSEPDSLDSVESFEPYVRIKTEKGVEHNIYIRTWERKRKFKDEDGRWQEEVLATYEQMPLIPAWAISVHKSQGQSFEKAHFDPAKIFDAGQGYVALSRVRSLAGLTLERPFAPRSFTANAHVKQFYNEL